MRRAVAAGVARRRARETARANGCFCAWATLSLTRPRWNAHSAVARRRLAAFGASLERASARAAKHRFDAWALAHAAAGAARRAAEAAVAAEEAGRRARAAREARERDRAEAVAAAERSVAESALARETMAHHVARLDVAALGDGDSNRLANEPDPSAGPPVPPVWS